MTYSDFQKEMAFRGFTDTPLSLGEFVLVRQHFMDPVAIGLDVACGETLEDTMRLEFSIRKGLLVEALRSGEYQQSSRALRTESGFCCLGVACDLAKDEVGGSWVEQENTWCFSVNGLPEHVRLPERVQNYYGFTTSYGGFKEGNTSLSHLNDHGANFAEIADTIEKEPAGLFTWTGQQGEEK